LYDTTAGEIPKRTQRMSRSPKAFGLEGFGPISFSFCLSGVLYRETNRLTVPKALFAL
jgi:hypothetical protein